MNFIFFGMTITAWQLFAALGLGCIVLEIFVPSLIMLPIGLAMLITAPLTLFIEDVSSQLVCFSMIATLVLALFQKFVKPKFVAKKDLSNVSSMIGKIALVEDEVDPTEARGSIKLYGDIWRAVSSENLRISHGEKVKIIALDGNKVIVETIK